MVFGSGSATASIRVSYTIQPPASATAGDQHGQTWSQAARRAVSVRLGSRDLFTSIERPGIDPGPVGDASAAARMSRLATGSTIVTPISVSVLRPDLLRLRPSSACGDLFDLTQCVLTFLSGSVDYVSANVGSSAFQRSTISSILKARPCRAYQKTGEIQLRR